MPEFEIIKTRHASQHICGHRDCPHRVGKSSESSRVSVTAETRDAALAKARRLPASAWQDVPA